MVIDKENVTEHFYAILPNGKAYMVDWCSILNDGRWCRVPVSNDRDNNIYFGTEEPLDVCKEKIVKKQTINATSYDVIVFRRSDDDRCTLVADYKL